MNIEQFVYNPVFYIWFGYSVLFGSAAFISMIAKNSKRNIFSYRKNKYKYFNPISGYLSLFMIWFSYASLQNESSNVLAYMSLIFGAINFIFIILWLVHENLVNDYQQFDNISFSLRRIKASLFAEITLPIEISDQVRKCRVDLIVDCAGDYIGLDIVFSINEIEWNRTRTLSITEVISVPESVNSVYLKFESNSLLTNSHPARYSAFKAVIFQNDSQSSYDVITLVHDSNRAYEIRIAKDSRGVINGDQLVKNFN